MAYAKLVEDKANGTAVAWTRSARRSQASRRSSPRAASRRGHMRPRPLRVGNVYIPEPGPDYPWVNDYQQEHYRFPRGANDDQVDCASQAINYLSTAGRGVGDWLAAMDAVTPDTYAPPNVPTGGGVQEQASPPRPREPAPECRRRD